MECCKLWILRRKMKGFFFLYQWITIVLYFAKHYFLFKRTSTPRNTDSSVLWYFRGTIVSPTPWGAGTLIPSRASCGPHPPPPFQLLWDDKSADIWVDPRSCVGSWFGHQAVGNRFFPLPSSIKSSSIRSIRHEIYEQVFARMQIQILTSDDLISSTDVCWECFMVALHQYEDQVPEKGFKSVAFWFTFSGAFGEQGEKMLLRPISCKHSHLSHISYRPPGSKGLPKSSSNYTPPSDASILSPSVSVVITPRTGSSLHHEAQVLKNGKGLP